MRLIVYFFGRFNLSSINTSIENLLSMATSVSLPFDDLISSAKIGLVDFKKEHIVLLSPDLSQSNYEALSTMQ